MLGDVEEPDDDHHDDDGHDDDEAAWEFLPVVVGSDPTPMP